MKNILKIYPDKIIIFCFYFLFFFIPLILTPFNYELFEYNKMMLAYSLTGVVIGAWTIKMVIKREINIARSPLDLPLMLFLVSQFVSTLFSLDRHVSVWGYYSRFNGGLLSTICYILLYYAFISNFPKAKIIKLFSVILTSGLLVSLYGILEHFGIDKNIWVQDVQNRVFSTLGQPNWLAAYLAVLIPITIGLSINSKIPAKGRSASGGKNQNQFRLGQNDKERFTDIGLFVYWIIGLLFYLTLLFTKSRSGFLGFWIANSVFWIIFFIKYRIQFIKLFIILNSLFLILTFFFGTPFQSLNHFTYSELIKSDSSPLTQNLPPIKPTGDSIISTGITESGKIRNIVWKGAIDIFRHYPLFGSGVETFAFAYYKYRPVEHNLTSEWDFLYNKAHNEYLNFAANTGIFGLGSYLLIIGSFIWWNIHKFKAQMSNVKTSLNRQLAVDLNLWILIFGLFTAWFSILITNFFGFSVVIVQLFFFLIPAISFLASDSLSFVYFLRPKTIPPMKQPVYMGRFNNVTINRVQYSLSIILFFVTCYLLFVIFRLWYADTVFATGYHYARVQNYYVAYQSIKEAILLNRNEPFYYDELALPASVLAVSFQDEKQATFSSQLKEEAILASNIAIAISPNNVNYWKTRTRVYYVLSQLDPKYLQDSVVSLEVARSLSPADPKILYNLAVMYDKSGKKNQAVESLVETTKLKPDYSDAYLALALLYDREGEKQKAREALNFILTRINPNDEEAKKKLEELK